MKADFLILSSINISLRHKSYQIAKLRIPREGSERLRPMLNAYMSGAVIVIVCKMRDTSSDTKVF